MICTSSDHGLNTCEVSKDWHKTVGVANTKYLEPIHFGHKYDYIQLVKKVTKNNLSAMLHASETDKPATQ